MPTKISLLVTVTLLVLLDAAALRASAMSLSPGKYLRLPRLRPSVASTTVAGDHTALGLPRPGPLEPLPLSKTRHHTLSTDSCLEEFGVREAEGLSDTEARSRLDRVGSNALTEIPRKTIVHAVVEQFEDSLVQVLLGIASTSAILACFEKNIHAFIEPAIIGAILLINAIVGALQSMSAQDALSALQKLQPSFAVIKRKGEWVEIPVANIVPGDIVSLRTGDRVPADGRVLSCKSSTMRVDESSLTGESESVFKDADVVVESSTAVAGLADMSNMVFGGSLVTEGSCSFVVTKTGANTEIGQINAGIMTAKQDSIRTPLMESLETFTGQLYKIVTAICLSMWIVSIPKFSGSVFSSWSQGAVHYAKVAVALGVAAIPEGLPAVITLSLALGTSKMAKRNVIVRKLSSVETLGCTSVICTDKTGTLTTNQMTVKKIVTLKRPRDNDVYSKSNIDDIEVEERTVEGTSYEPVLGAVNGFSWTNSNTIFFQDFAAICALCNNAQIKYDIADTSFHHLGEPTEAALKVLVEKLGVPKSPDIELLSSNPIQMAHQSSDYWSQRYAYLAELEFSRDRKMMSVVLRDLNLLRNRIFTKGAAEIVLSRCNRIKLENGDVVPMTPSLRLKISRSFESMAKQSFRCLGLAYKDASEVSNELNSVESPDDLAQLPLLNSPERFELCERDMVFVGMCGILDPPRPEVRSAILKTGEAGVRVFMITGDSKQTATAIAKEVGILDNDTGDIGGRVFNGKDFFNLSKQNQVELLKQRGNLVFCRAEPQQKQMLVRLLSEIGEVIAMTGDGVNDAPALQQADIGIAMGITGTEVSKNAADMILADDNFSSIVSAIEEGRGIYNNMKTFIFFLVSSNIGEVLSIFTAALLGLPDLLTPVHLLWVNLVTDGPPATALSFNPSGRDVMKQPPRSRYEPLFTKSLLLRLLASGSYVAFATIGSFVWWFLDKGVSMTDLMKWESTKTKAGSEGSGGTLYQILSTSLAPPQTIALSVLVLMELMKALSAVSLDSSMLTSPPGRNPTLIVGTLVPLVAHLFFMYVPALSTILRLSPLSLREWKVVLAFAVPILFVEEVLKAMTRNRNNSNRSTVVGNDKNSTSSP